jgi:hypothetical protein
MDAQAKEIKNKVMCEINSFAIVYFFFDERLFTNCVVSRLVGLYRKKIFNPLDSSQRLRLLNTSLVSSNVP